MMAFITGIVGAFAEAWQEVRVHRGRVLLSLVGVAAAVCALTASVAASNLAQQGLIERNEASSGRQATLTMAVGTPSADAGITDLIEESWFAALERYNITYASRVEYSSTLIPSDIGQADSQVRVVDQSYAVIHRIRMNEGSWFAPGDSTRLAPVIVVNNAFWQGIGSPDLRTHPTVLLGGRNALIVGVYADAGETYPGLFALTAHRDQLLLQSDASRSYEMWVPPTAQEDLATRIKGDLQASLPEGSTVSVDRTDFGANSEDPTVIFRIITLVIGGIILVLGALGLLNIALVTVRQRIREIGIRRSFGATSGRVFFSVLMESVVATSIAGLAGVIGAVLLVSIPAVSSIVSLGTLQDVPPFPVEAAIVGFVAATLVGALAGLIPALIAVRVKVIDAIRF